LYHNSNIFGSCIIHILYTECAKIKKKQFWRQKVNIVFLVMLSCMWQLSVGLQKVHNLCAS